jgi:translocating chain-associated membrane protein 1
VEHFGELTMSSTFRKLGSKKDKKNPPILSHEFVIQNHADIVSCFAMVFVVGLMVQATTSIASIFIVMSHNVSLATDELTRSEPLYESGWKDFPAIGFYTLISIIMHAILQEYVLDKISKKLHLSKYKLSKFNESGQLVVFYLISFLWGIEIVLREQFAAEMSKFWVDFPIHPMSFLHKLYFIIQLSYYVHMLPELYFQKVRRDEQAGKIKHSLAGAFVIGFFYFFAFRRIAVVLLTLHYFSEFFNHAFELIGVFDREEKYSKFRVLNNFIFLLTAFSTLVLSFLTFFTGISKNHATMGFLGLFVAFSLEGFLIFRFVFRLRRDSRETIAKSKQIKTEGGSQIRKERRKESDLPEADQNNSAVPNVKKIKTK